MQRRTFITVTASASVTALAGCSDIGSDDDGEELGTPAPNTQVYFDHDSESGTVKITHSGGDALTADNTGDLTVTAPSHVTVNFDSGDENPKFESPSPGDTSATVTGTISSGDLIAIVENVASGDEISVNWEATDGGTSSTLGTFETPEGEDLGTPAPNTQVHFDHDSESRMVRISHSGGDSLTTDNTGNVTVSVPDQATVTFGTGNEDSKFESKSGNTSAVVTGTISSGDLIATVENVTSGDTITVNWEATDGEQSSSLGSFESP